MPVYGLLHTVCPTRERQNGTMAERAVQIEVPDEIRWVIGRRKTVGMTDLKALALTMLCRGPPGTAGREPLCGTRASRTVRPLRSRCVHHTFGVGTHYQLPISGGSARKIVVASRIVHLDISKNRGETELCWNPIAGAFWIHCGKVECPSYVVGENCGVPHESGEIVSDHCSEASRRK